MAAGGSKRDGGRFPTRKAVSQIGVLLKKLLAKFRKFRQWKQYNSPNSTKNRNNC